MASYVVTMTSPVIEANSPEAAIRYADDHGGNHWEAVEPDVMWCRPVTVTALRDDWADRPGLTKQAKLALVNLPDAKLASAIRLAFAEYESLWFDVLDGTRGDATRLLLEELGLEESED